jgi:hypothetical protein
MARARGLALPRTPGGDAALAALRRGAKALRARARARLGPLLTRWLRAAARASATRACACIHAHLAALAGHAALSLAELDATSVESLLCAHVFLGANLPWTLEPPVAASGRFALRPGELPPPDNRGASSDADEGATAGGGARERKVSSTAAGKARSLAPSTVSAASVDDDAVEEVLPCLEQLELFALFQRHRNKVLQWLRARPREADAIFEVCARPSRV